MKVFGCAVLFAAGCAWSWFTGDFGVPLIATLCAGFAGAAKYCNSVER
jgi:hypothetical protein